MKDKHLDIPAEASMDKHINFLEAEQKTAAGNIPDDERFGSTGQDKERKSEWQKAMEEAENDRNKNSE